MNVNIDLMEEHVIQIHGGITINANVSVKTVMYVKMIPFKCNCEYRKYLASIMDDSAIICGEVIESYDEDSEGKSKDKKTKTVPKYFNEKNITCKTQHFYILFEFLLITIALLIAASIYCYLIKYRAKQKHL